MSRSVVAMVAAGAGRGRRGSREYVRGWGDLR